MNDPAPAPATPAAPAPISAIESIYGPSKPAASAPDPTPEPVSDPAPADPVPEPAADPAAPADPNAPVVEEVELSSLSELAEHFELDPEWLKTLKVSEKVNGAEVQFSIADALATHRKVQAADAHLADAKNRSKALLDEAVQQKEAWATSVATVNKLLQSLEVEVNRDSRSVDMEKLRREDPAEWAARQKEIDDRRTRLNALKNEAQQGIQAAVQKTATEQAQALNQRLPQERQVLIERVPEWADEAKAGAERQEVATYLANEGFSPQDIRGIAYNGRAMAMAVKAMRYDQGKDKLEITKKKVVKIPKVLKPGPKPAAAKPNGAAKTDPASILYGS